MSVATFIPNGRTSCVQKGDIALQVQTEYAYRPYPRLTTTVLNNGQVVHKIEKKLEHPIASVEEQTEVERMITRQHSEVVAIIKENAASNPAMIQKFKESTSEYLSLADRIKAIPGVQKIFDLDNDGNFSSRQLDEQFRNVYGTIYKGLKDLIEVFVLMPGITMSRERGVYEIERNRLYLVSCGDEIYVVMVKSGSASVVYEQVFRKAVDDFFAAS